MGEMEAINKLMNKLYEAEALAKALTPEQLRYALHLTNIKYLEKSYNEMEARKKR